MRSIVRFQFELDEPDARPFDEPEVIGEEITFPDLSHIHIRRITRRGKWVEVEGKPFGIWTVVT